LYSKILSFNAQKYYLIGAEQEDLLQEGILGLLKAIKFYDETKSSFSSFAFLCIRREMISAIRKANTQKNSVLNEALTTSSMIEDSSDVDNYISSENNPEEAYLLKEEIKEFKNFSDKNFSKFEKEVLKYLIRGYSYREIAKILKEVGVKFFGVANLEEAIELQEAGIKDKILFNFFNSLHKSS